MTPEEIIEKGRAAEALLNNPVLEEAFSTTLNSMFAEFCTTEAEQGVERDAIWAKVNALRDFKQQLEAWVSNGKVEAMNREQDFKR